MLSFLLGLVSSSFFVFWASVELNVISFSVIFIVLELISSVSPLKYFLLQSAASGLLFLGGCLDLLLAPSLTEMFFWVRLSFKIAIAPLHGWFINIAPCITWKRFFFLSTFQKILPIWGFYILAYRWAIWSVLLRVLFSVLGGIFAHEIKLMLVHSSILNLGWMLRARNPSIALMAMLIYRITLGGIVGVVEEINGGVVWDYIRSISSYLSGLLLFLIFLSLMGLPPLLGFWIKIHIIADTIFFTGGYLVMYLLLGAGVFIYIYLRRVCRLVMMTALLSGWEAEGSASIAPPLLLLLLGPLLLIIFFCFFRNLTPKKIFYIKHLNYANRVETQKRVPPLRIVICAFALSRAITYWSPVAPII